MKKQLQRKVEFRSTIAEWKDDDTVPVGAPGVPHLGGVEPTVPGHQARPHPSANNF